MALVTLSRYRNVRIHERIQVEIDDTMLDEGNYFDENGAPSSAFDQFACDNGEVVDSSSNALEEDQLEFFVEEIV